MQGWTSPLMEAVRLACSGLETPQNEKPNLGNTQKISYAFLLGLLPHLFVTGSAVSPLIPSLRTLAPTGRNLRLAKVDLPSLIWNKIPTQKRHVIFFAFLSSFKTRLDNYQGGLGRNPAVGAACVWPGISSVFAYFLRSKSKARHRRHSTGRKPTIKTLGADL